MKFLVAICLAHMALPSAIVFPSEIECPPAHRIVQFEGKNWVVNAADQTSGEEIDGRAFLRLDGPNRPFAYLENVEFENGTIEVDLAAHPRAVPGVVFRGQLDGDSHDKVFFHHRHSEAMKGNKRVSQAVVTQRDGTTLVLIIRKIDDTDCVDPSGTPDWFHVKIVVHGSKVEVFIDGSNEPDFEVAGMFDESGKGSLGICGGGACFANFRCTPER